MVGIKDRDGRVLQNTGPLFADVSKHFPPGQYTQFCNALGVLYQQAKKLLKRSSNDYEEALIDALAIWEINSDSTNIVTRADLEKALIEAEAGGLCTIIHDHFNKEIPLKSSVPPPPRKQPIHQSQPSVIDQSGAFSASGSAYVKNNTMIGHQVHNTYHSRSSSVPKAKKRPLQSKSSAHSEPSTKKRKKSSASTTRPTTKKSKPKQGSSGGQQKPKSAKATGGQQRAKSAKATGNPKRNASKLKHKATTDKKKTTQAKKAPKAAKKKPTKTKKAAKPKAPSRKKTTKKRAAGKSSIKSKKGRGKI